METPTDLSDSTIKQLKSLITANANSAEIFRSASDLAQSNGLTDLLRTIAIQRQANAKDLQQALALTGEMKQYETSLAEPLQAWFMKVRDKFQSEEEVGLLSELERSEDRILHAYEDVLKSTAGSPLNARLHQQNASVKQHHDQIRDMRNAAKARA